MEWMLYSILIVIVASACVAFTLRSNRNPIETNARSVALLLRLFNSD